MSEEPKYEVTWFHEDGEITKTTYNTWDEAAKAVERTGFGQWQTPAEFVLKRNSVMIKAVRS